MKKEFTIKDEWVSFEIHPETPKEGVLLSEKFGQANLEGMLETLRRSGSQYGIEFGGHTLLSNSRMALEASEFAREQGKFDEFHDKIFYAYFTECKDIGDKALILEIAEQVGLDKQELESALDSGKYKTALEEAGQLGRAYGITGTPTFIINNKYKIVGAHPLESIKNYLRNIEAEEE